MLQKGKNCIQNVKHRWYRFHACTRQRFLSFVQFWVCVCYVSSSLFCNYVHNYIYMFRVHYFVVYHLLKWLILSKPFCVKHLKSPGPLYVDCSDERICVYIHTRMLHISDTTKYILYLKNQYLFYLFIEWIANHTNSDWNAHIK